MTAYDIHLSVTVRVTVNDDNVIDRCVNDEDGWRTQMFYSDLIDRDSVLRHLAYNCVANGTWGARKLDGWADLPWDAATMDVTDAEVDSVKLA